MAEVEGRRANLDFLAGGGDLGRLMRSHDWSSTPLGNPESWPQSLRSAVSIMLNSRYPIALYWGEALALLYNDAWSPIPGGKHPWALGRPGREVWPEIWDAIGPLYARVLSTGEGVWQEDELLPMRRHGYVEECYFNFTFSPVRGEDGRIDGIFNAVVETTDRVLSERRLRTLGKLGERAERSLLAETVCERAAAILAENKADAPFVLVYLRRDDEAHLVAVEGIESSSPAAPSSINLIEGELPTWRLGYVDRENTSIVSGIHAGIIVREAVWPEPVIQASVTPIRAAGETRPTAFLVVGINPRRSLDEAYRSFFAAAAGYIANELATARAYAEERHRMDALAEIDRAKTAFFSNVSHEFRTPLTLMLGPIEDALADGENLPSRQRERLDVAHRNALRLLRLVNSLLDFSRIEAGRAEVNCKPTDLAAFTVDLVSSFRAATDKAGLRLLVDAPPFSEPALVDRDMWETIVLNLVSNAFKFTFEGEIRVELREEKDCARLIVRDSGTGIPASDLPRLFDRFYRVEGAQGRSFEGSGIGLALVDELVKRHGGDIEVDSVLGRGSAFTVTIPLGAERRSVQRVDENASSTAKGRRSGGVIEEALRWLPDDGDDALVDSRVHDFAPAPEQRGTKRKRVLIADDNQDLRIYISRLLAQDGYEVETVCDGAAALASARARRPELLVADVMMPGLDGFALLRAVREDPALRDLPVIMLSARAGEEAKLEGLNAGADDYLIKPFSGRELLARVTATIAMAQMRRESENALRVSEERLRLATEAADVGFWDVDVINDILTWPQRVKEMFGISPAAPVHMRDFYEGLHPKDREATSASFAAACNPEQRAVYDVEFRTVGKEDGVVRWVAAKGRGIFDVSGRCVRVIGTAIEITARKNAATAHAATQARYETLFGSIEAGYCVVEVDLDSNGGRTDLRVVEANPAFYRQTGFPGSILGCWLRETVPGLEEHWYEIFGRVARSGKADRFEQVSDFLGRWFDVYALCIGKPRHRQVAILFNDVTERRNAEQRLRELNETLERRVAEALAEKKLLADIVEGTDAFVQVLDEKFRWLAINNSAANEFARIYGVRPTVGRCMLDLLADRPEHREAVRAVWTRALTGEEFTEVGEFGDPGHDRRLYEMKYNVLCDEGGRQIGAYQFVYDVTQRIAEQRRLAEAEEQLRHAQKMEAMGQLTGGVAHDFNNLLTPIVGSLDMLLRKGVGSEREQRLIAGAMQSAERARTLVQRLLAFARRQPLQATPVDIPKLVTGMADLIGSTSGPQIRVVIDARGELPPAMADLNQLEMALLNLSVNARDAMLEGGTLRISASEDRISMNHPSNLRPGSYIRLSVADTGVGMDEATLSRAVDPFFSTKGVGKGTGLGLSMAHGLASQLGGALTIQSHRGVGTNVEIWLPISDAPLELATTVAQAAQRGVQAGTVLLVDDEELVRVSTADMLGDLGFEVIEAKSAEDALLLIREGFRPDLLVTDHLMPGMNGTDLARIVQAEQPDTRILLVSGYAETEGVAPDLPRLTKPFRNDELAAILAALLPE